MTNGQHPTVHGTGFTLASNISLVNICTEVCDNGRICLLNQPESRVLSDSMAHLTPSRAKVEHHVPVVELGNRL